MSETNNLVHHPGIFRHAATLLYDWLLLLAVLMLASLIAVALNHGQAIAPGNIFFKLYLLLVIIFYYTWFWTHGGQTLGMRAWKVYLLGHDDHHITWRQALARIVISLLSWILLGAGYWRAWFCRDGLSWADRVSHTRLVFKK